MILEGIAVGSAGMVVGAVIMKLLLKIKRVERKIDRSEKKKYEAMDDPDLLLKRLNENGVMVDDGDEISFSVEVKDGRKQLIQNVTKNAVPGGTPNIKKLTKENNEIQGDDGKKTKK